MAAETKTVRMTQKVSRKGLKPTLCCLPSYFQGGRESSFIWVPPDAWLGYKVTFYCPKQAN